ncbi:uncharacterized protein LOC108630987 [Ceratina calcarata]|uniref:Uncharacterized protein LOC108630987 n=1 Tax=Ceratina calcarata TaxID=156304 RepID=A0AAJ7NDP1_9HYME|nr:uncharacterized protein LOC108630987 [Ceratina calcarata]
MGKKRLDIRFNGSAEGKDLVGSKDDKGTSRFWHRIQRNEWTFTLLLLLISLSMILKKLYTYYGSNSQLQNNVASSTSVFSNVSNLLLSHLPDVSQFDAKQLSIVSEKFVNFSQYDDVVSVTTSFCKTFGWLIRAAVCGLITMGFTWFIIYKDSNVPGINPPSPFSPSKHRFTRESRIQINYLMGIINGVLIFIYMCL